MYFAYSWDMKRKASRAFKPIKDQVIVIELQHALRAVADFEALPLAAAGVAFLAATSYRRSKQT